MRWFVVLLLTPAFAGCAVPPDAPALDSFDYCLANKSRFTAEGRLYSLDGCYHVLLNSTTPDSHTARIPENTTGLVVDFRLPVGTIAAEARIDAGDGVYEAEPRWRATNAYWTHQFVLSRCDLEEIDFQWSSVGTARVRLMAAVSSDFENATRDDRASCNGYWG